jgi:stress response protein YsnF
VCGNKTRELAGCGVGAVDDEGHEEQREGQVFGVEVQDEEVDLTGWVVLCESVCVCERECGEEGVAVEEEACDCL